MRSEFKATLQAILIIAEKSKTVEEIITAINRIIENL